MEKLWVSASIKTLPGHSPEKVADALRQLMKTTQLEPGCIQFDIHQHLDNPTHFTLWECWQDKAALEAHLNALHTKEYFSFNFTELRYIEKMQHL